MTPEQRQRVFELFDRVRGAPQQQRVELLASLCPDDSVVSAEVISLLQHASGLSAAPSGRSETAAVDGTALVHEALGRLGAAAASGAARELVGARIGPYEIVELIGEGGMGAVYKAQQRAPLQRTVALKLTNLGMDSASVIARFDSERHALARMDHPNVAKVLDAGATDVGRPYFVMEYVPGQQIVMFCDEQKLSVRQRLELFLPVCDAIAHAHSKAIIHRDIKASNVLAYLRDGRPAVKVIDFGIAKALAGDRLTDFTLNTGANQVVGTYESMSPEQADGSPDIDTRSDVYSLGVLLYELLSGTRPLDREALASAPEHEIRRIIREVEPPRPSTLLSGMGNGATAIAAARGTKPDSLARQLVGELEWIPLKAMRKDRDRRYASPLQLAEDIRNYLERKPLIAGPESKLYRARKFVRRHRVPIAALVTIAALLIAGATGTTIGMLRAHREQLIAEQRQRESDAVVAFMNSDVFGNATPDSIRDISVRDTIVHVMLEPAVKSVRERFKDQPLVRATVMYQIGQAFVKLGRYGEAEQLFRDVVDVRRPLLGSDDPRTMSATNDLAVALGWMGRDKECAELLKEVMERDRRVLGDDDTDTITSINNYAFQLFARLGRAEEAEPLFREALSRSRRVQGDDNQQTIRQMMNYAGALDAVGRGAEAEPLLREAMERRRRLLGPDHLLTINAISAYGQMLRMHGHAADAEPLLRESLELRRKVLGVDHSATIAATDALAGALQALGKLDEAEADFKDAVERSRRVFGEDYPNSITIRNNYAGLLQQRGRSSEAEAIFQDVLMRRQRLLGDKHPDVARSMYNLAMVRQSLGRWDDAEHLFRDALRISQAVHGPNHPETRRYAEALSSLLQKAGRTDEAAAVKAPR